MSLTVEDRNRTTWQRIQARCESVVGRKLADELASVLLPYVVSERSEHDDARVHGADADGDADARANLIHRISTVNFKPGVLAALERVIDKTLEGGKVLIITDSDLAFAVEKVIRHGSPSVGAVSDTAGPTVGAVPGANTSGAPGTPHPEAP